VVLDSAGRLQIPGDQRALAGIGRRARVELVDGGILIRPTDEDRIELAGADAAAGADTAYKSLYNAEPLPAPTNGLVKGKRWWQLRRAKPES
jgi:hypothetical protein